MRQRLCAFLLVLLVLSPSAIRAQEEYANTLYIHPISLILGTAVELIPVMIYVTYEKQLSNPQNALIITPGFSYWSLGVEGSQISATGVGIGAGLRHYLSSEQGNAGYYLQAKADIGYGNATVEDDLLGNDSASGVDMTLIFYWGSKKQFDRIAVMSDIGLGYQFSSYSVSSSDLDFDQTGLALDINFGIGFGF